MWNDAMTSILMCKHGQSLVSLSMSEYNPYFRLLRDANRLCRFWWISVISWISNIIFVWIDSMTSILMCRHGQSVVDLSMSEYDPYFRLLRQANRLCRFWCISDISWISVIFFCVWNYVMTSILMCRYGQSVVDLSISE